MISKGRREQTDIFGHACMTILSKVLDKDNDDQVPETDIAATTFAADGAKVGIGLHHHDKLDEDYKCNGRDYYDDGGSDDDLGVFCICLLTNIRNTNIS